MSEEEHGVDRVRPLATGMESADWASDLWRRGCERLATELPEQQFNTWIRPLPPATLAGIALLIAGVVWALRIKPVRTPE